MVGDKELPMTGANFRYSSHTTDTRAGDATPERRAAATAHYDAAPIAVAAHDDYL